MADVTRLSHIYETNEAIDRRGAELGSRLGKGEALLYFVVVEDYGRTELGLTSVSFSDIAVSNESSRVVQAIQSGSQRFDDPFEASSRARKKTAPDVQAQSSLPGLGE